MSWQHAAAWAVAGAVGAVAVLVGAALASCYVLAESEAQASEDLADWLRGRAR